MKLVFSLVKLHAITWFQSLIIGLLMTNTLLSILYICVGVLWSIWSLRNDLIFSGITWLSLKQIWWIILRTIKEMRALFQGIEDDLGGKLLPTLPLGPASTECG
jgi:hypothetical protein